MAHHAVQALHVGLQLLARTARLLCALPQHVPHLGSVGVGVEQEAVRLTPVTTSPGESKVCRSKSVSITVVTELHQSETLVEASVDVEQEAVPDARHDLPWEAKGVSGQRTSVGVGGWGSSVLGVDVEQEAVCLTPVLTSP